MLFNPLIPQLTFDGHTGKLYHASLPVTEYALIARYITNDTDLKFLPGRRK